MKQAYVVKLGAETNPSKPEFVGWVEEIDTGREQRFTSTEELLTFLAECFDRESRKRLKQTNPAVGVKE